MQHTPNSVTTELDPDVPSESPESNGGEAPVEASAEEQQVCSPSEESPQDPAGAAIEPLAVAGEAAAQALAPLEDPTDDGDPGDLAEGAEEEAVHKGEELGTGELRSDAELARELSALLFSSPEALGQGRIRMLLERPSSSRVRDVLASLEAQLEDSPLPIVLRKIAGGWRLLTDPQMGDVVARMRKEQRPEKITGAAMETLAIVAYRQPVTKAEVEAIRGVQAGPMLRTLVDRGLARVSGRADLPGQPLQYGTTKDFLERFGLDSIKELPRDGELTEE